MFRRAASVIAASISKNLHPTSNILAITARSTNAPSSSIARNFRSMTFQPSRHWSFNSMKNSASSSSVVWSLIALNGGVYLLWQSDPYFASKHFVVSLDSMRAGRIWTIITAAFSQQDTSHLFSNMISLYFFGSDIGRIFGGKKLLLLYLAGGFFGSAAHLGWTYYKEQTSPLKRRWGYTPPTQGALGASAAVNAIMLMDILMFPTRTILLYGFIPLPAALLGVLWLYNDVGGVLGGGVRSGTAHSGHLGGAATGLAFYMAFKRGRLRPAGW